MTKTFARPWNSAMPFNHLLFESLQPGKTKAEDRKSGCHTSADLERGTDETVLLFHLDDEQTRKRLGLSGKKCCDYLYFYKSKHQFLLIFVELKGGDPANAVEQFSAAIDAVCKPPDQGRSWRIRARAVIVSATVTPRDWSTILGKMRERRIDVYFGTSKKNRPCFLKEINGLF